MAALWVYRQARPERDGSGPAAVAAAATVHARRMAIAQPTRPTRPDDAARLQQIETAAGAAFADVGMPEVAADEPLSIDALASYATARRSWVVVDEHDLPLGYILADVIDGCAHVEQVSVHPDHQACGLGRRLLDEVETWARQQAMPALTLTTFADVPWNGPLYAHLGFVALPGGEIGPELQAVCDDEAADGLDPARRLCMRRDVRPLS